MFSGNLYKVVVAGEGGVGKTTLIKRLTTGEFSQSKTTIGVGFAIANVKIEDKPIKLQIWDLGGEERFRMILPQFCAGAHGAIVVFDLTRYSSFVALPEWINIIKKSTNDAPIVLAGSKSDLLEYHTIDEYQIKEVIEKYGIVAYYETSAKTGTNVVDVFTSLAKAIIHKTSKIVNVI